MFKYRVPELLDSFALWDLICSFGIKRPHCPVGPPSWDLVNPQVPDGVYKPPHVYCRMGFLSTLPFPALHLSRNAAIVSESLKISNQSMAK